MCDASNRVQSYLSLQLWKAAKNNFFSFSQLYLVFRLKQKYGLMLVSTFASRKKRAKLLIGSPAWSIHIRFSQTQHSLFLVDCASLVAFTWLHPRRRNKHHDSQGCNSKCVLGFSAMWVLLAGHSWVMRETALEPPASDIFAFLNAPNAINHC